MLCCQKNKLFSLEGCRFNIERAKEQTARVVMFKEYNIMNSFTLECSFYGKEIQPEDPTAAKKQGEQSALMRGCYSQQQLQNKKKKYEHMSVPEYQSLGTTMIESLHAYLPSQLHNLKFLGGQILQVFYEEFTKLVPAYILKREEEKRLKQEQESKTKEAQAKAKGKQVLRSNTNDNKRVNDESSIEKS